MQDHADLLAASTLNIAAIKQLKAENVALTSNKEDLATKLESCNNELTDSKVRP